MRRKLIIVLSALAFLGLLSAVEQIAVRRITDAALVHTHEILVEIHDGAFEAAKEKAHTLDRAWDRQAGWLETLVDHGSTDEVRYALSRLIAALDGEDKAAALIYSCELEGGIEHVYERQELTLQNVF